MRVQVYRNLHKNCYSVRDIKTRKVLLHLKEVYLFNVKFKVSKKGRERVLKERRKNVHAYIEGGFKGQIPKSLKKMGTAYYNPYKTETFVINGQPIYEASLVVMRDNFTIEVYE